MPLFEVNFDAMKATTKDVTSKVTEISREPLETPSEPPRDDPIILENAIVASEPELEKAPTGTAANVSSDYGSGLTFDQIQTALNELKAKTNRPRAVDFFVSKHTVLDTNE